MLITADYPYYRDDPSVWADRLRAIRDDLGISVITSYVPWRHHQPAADRPPVFDDVLEYLEICSSLGLSVVAKPGPFIHAELDYGGLPDWVESMDPVLDSTGSPSRWMGRPLPAPLAPAFLGRVTEWLAAVGKEVLLPGGPVTAVQIANEGIYTSGALPLTAYDYSPSGLAFFHELLRSWYGTPERYNAIHGTTCRSWADVPPGGADWGRFHAEYLAKVYRVWTDAVATELPVVVNLNPPTVPELDDWLARVQPSLWGGIAYGFTNWMGVVSADPAAQARYVIAAKRAPGPNLEENWGFAELYDPAYADGATSFHQTLLALAAGATGFNVYTGVATSTWSPELDSVHAPPYPDKAPIAADGRPTVKAAAVRALADFFTAHGEEFLACAPAYGGAFGLYLPLAGLGRLAGPLLDFHARMRAQGRDYALFDLESATQEELAAHPVLTVADGSAVRELLDAYTAGGGRVVVEGQDAPAPPPAVAVLRGRADAFWRAHPARDVGYLTVLVQDDNDGPVTVSTPVGEVEVVCARGGAAVLRLADGCLDDVVVKGVNGHLGSHVDASVSYGGGRLTGRGDLVVIRPAAPGTAASGRSASPE